MDRISNTILYSNNPHLTRTHRYDKHKTFWLRVDSINLSRKISNFSHHNILLLSTDRKYRRTLSSQQQKWYCQNFNHKLHIGGSNRSVNHRPIQSRIFFLSLLDTRSPGPK